MLNQLWGILILDQTFLLSAWHGTSGEFVFNPLWPNVPPYRIPRITRQMDNKAKTKRENNGLRKKFRYQRVKEKVRLKFVEIPCLLRSCTSTNYDSVWDPSKKPVASGASKDDKMRVAPRSSGELHYNQNCLVKVPENLKGVVTTLSPVTRYFSRRVQESTKIAKNTAIARDGQLLRKILQFTAFERMIPNRNSNPKSIPDPIAIPNPNSDANSKRNANLIDNVNAIPTADR